MKKFMIIAALAVFMTGCVSTELGAVDNSALALGEGNENLGQTEIAIEPAIAPVDGVAEDRDSSKPPQLRIEVMTEQIASVMTMTTGTYCWTTEENGEGVGICVDCISPEEMAENGLVSAQINISELVKNPRVLLTDGGEITSVQCFGNGEVADVGFTADGEIILPDAPNGVAYSVDVTFPQGTVSYVFVASEQGINSGAGTSPVEEQTTPAYDPTAQTSLGYLPGGFYDPEHVVYTPEPPDIEILATSGRTAWTNITAKCGFYWEAEVNGDPTAITVDCPTPYQLANSDDIKLGMIDTSELTENLKVLLPEDAELVSAFCHSDTEDMPIEFTADGELVLPEAPVGRVYSVTVGYPQGECTYVFVTGSVAEFPSYGEDGLWHAEAWINYSSGEFHGFGNGYAVIDSVEKYAECFGGESDVYDRRYFEENALLVWTFDEGSGSVSHEYLGVTPDNEVLVKRTIPEIGTCDMAYYQLFVEVPQAVAYADYTLSFKDDFQGTQVQPVEDEETGETDGEVWFSGDITLVWIYRNYAWDYTCYGTFYDKDGREYSFELSDDEVMINDDQLMFKLQLIYYTTPTAEVVFSEDAMALILDDLSDVNEKTGFDVENIAHDWGQYTLYGVRYDGDSAELVKIYSYGDNVYQPRDRAAQKVLKRFSEEIALPQV